MGLLQKWAGSIRNNVTAPLATAVERGVKGLNKVVDQGITALPLNRQQAIDAAKVAALAAGGYYAAPYLAGAANTAGAAAAGAGEAAMTAGADILGGTGLTQAAINSALGGTPGINPGAPSPTGGGSFTGLNWLDLAGQGVALYNNYKTATGADNIDPAAARAATDPFAPYRGKYAQQLDALMANPSSVTTLPGYQFMQKQGEQAVLRNLAATGRTASGNEMLALQEQGQGLAGKMYTDQFNKLAELSGANISPASGGTAQMAAQQQNLQTQGAGAKATAESWGGALQNPIVQQGANKVFDYVFGA